MKYIIPSSILHKTLYRNIYTVYSGNSNEKLLSTIKSNFSKNNSKDNSKKNLFFPYLFLLSHNCSTF